MYWKIEPWNRLKVKFDEALQSINKVIELFTDDVIIYMSE